MDRSGDIEDIIFVDPEAFDVARTIEIAAEVGRLNKLLTSRNRRYLLIGPGRWGSADRVARYPGKVGRHICGQGRG